jgi:hypothetical protein
MTDLVGLADATRDLARQLAASLRAGTATIAEARDLEVTIREAEGWLLSARNFLDPESPGT